MKDLAERCAKAESERDSARKELIDAHAYAARLFLIRAPQCKAFDSPDIIGVLSQLDNLMTRLIDKEDVKALVLDKDAIELALLANNGGGLDFRKEMCECDPEVGMVPCQYCAIDRLLRKALRTTNHAKSLGLL